jgi:PAS domain S-box-containing protein
MSDSMHASKKTLEQALQNSERRYRRLFESAKDGVLILDADTGKVVDVNPFLLQLLGYSYDALCGNHIWQLGAFKDIAASKDAFKALQDSEYIRYEDLPLQTLDGRSIAVEFVSNVYLVGDTKVIQCNIRDITGRKKTEERLEEAHRRLVDAKDVVDRVVEERTSELKEAYERLRVETEERKQTEVQLHQAQKMEAIGTLAGGIAHDFNNILAGIMGFAEMVYEDSAPDTPEHMRLGLILKGAERGRDLVKQILTFSRQTTHEKKPVVLCDIIEEVLKLLRPALPSTITIRKRNSTVDSVILADPVQMHQILMNLCMNAAHAMGEKGGVLEIVLSNVHFSADTPVYDPCLKSIDYLKLSVQDTGHGMEAETLKRIFDPFFTTKSPGEGTGLGLSVVHGIVSDHNGCVLVDSMPGKGSTFHVYLPKLSASVISELKSTMATPRGSERILFVDDEEMMIELGKVRLERLGYNVIAYTSSKEALQAFTRMPDQFDLVITDYTMPDLTGIDLAGKLIKIRPGIPIILCTGQGDACLAEKMKETGIKEVLMKPVTKNDLAQAIRRVLDVRIGK